MRVLILILIITFSIKTIHPKDIRDPYYPINPRGWSWFPSFYLQGGTFFRYGTMASKDGVTIKPRKLYGLGLDGHLGMILLRLNLGLGGEVAKFYQITEPSDVENSNTAGTKKSTYILLGKNFGKISILGKYYITSNYEFEYTNTLGNLGELSSPDTSYSVELTYHLNHNIYMALSLNHITYKEYNSSNSTVVLTDDSATTLKTYGFVFGYIF
ncbi:MAG: hypothetical protein K9K67_15575 [Bacteriovoracaceae bacterium]|nr:hypothetical protein [Bacteriovoracaceae bacterium]